MSAILLGHGKPVRPVKPRGGLISQRKPTSQSSTGFGGIPARAVDGNRNQHWGGRSCTHTNIQHRAWWQVNLKNRYRIYRVQIFNRRDCCGERLSNFVILVS